MADQDSSIQHPALRDDSADGDQQGMTEVDINTDQPQSQEEDEIPDTPVTAIPITAATQPDSQEQIANGETYLQQSDEGVDGTAEKLESDSNQVGQEVVQENHEAAGEDQPSFSPGNDQASTAIAIEQPLPAHQDQAPEQHQVDENAQETPTDPSSAVPSINVASSSPPALNHSALPPTSSQPQPQSQSQHSDQHQDTQTSSSINRSQSNASSRRDSVLSTTSISSSHTAGSTHSSKSGASLAAGSTVFVISALESILASKEAKKLPALRSACGRALAMVRFASGQKTPSNASKEEKERSSEGKRIESMDARIVFEPLRLACETKSSNLIVTSLDCIGKLVSYSFFVEDDLDENITPPLPTKTNDDGEPIPNSNGSSNPLPLADLVTETVCSTFSSSLSDLAQLQIIKALLATVLSTSVSVHQGSLLKAVRTVYNVFLMSKSSANQAVAQGCLTQMCHHVCGRVRPGKQREVESEKLREEAGIATNGNASEPQESAQEPQQVQESQAEPTSPPLEDVEIDPTSTASYSNAAEAQEDQNEIDRNGEGKEDGNEKSRNRSSEEKVTL